MIQNLQRRIGYLTSIEGMARRAREIATSIDSVQRTHYVQVGVHVPLDDAAAARIRQAEQEADLLIRRIAKCAAELL